MKRSQQGSVSRARWAAVGAAIAVSLGVGGVAVTHAVISSGEKAVFVPISPCRLFDLRLAPDQVGPRSAPLGPGETYTQLVRGANGNCTIPADATAVAMNVTAVGGTVASFLTIWPSDVAPRPLASNLNWVPGSPPTPNKVDVKLSADGKINLFNLTGTVSVLADVVGYYADHNHDDRYARRLQVTYDLAAGAVSGPIEVTANIPVALTGVQLQVDHRGVAQATLLSIPGVGGFIEWTGLESTAGSIITQGYSGVQGTHIVYLDWDHLVDVEVDSPTTIRIHNTSPGQRSGVVTLTW